jgi:hypothetical protein
MPRSVASGDYTLVLAVEASSRRDAFYRITRDRHTGALGCDCPRWIKQRASPEARSCKHTEVAHRLLQPSAAARSTPPPRAMADVHPLIQATREQWQGLTGNWSLDERTARIGDTPYQVILLQLTTMNGLAASGVVAFVAAHRRTTQELIPGVAGWAGFAIAASIAQQAGYRLVGQPPAHYRVDRTSSNPRTQARSAGQVGLTDILRVGERTDVDARTPQQRAEDTLRMFLGPLFTDLQHQGFLDVASQLYPGRVYRLRRDPERLRDRRVRVFEGGVYTRDLCIVRAQSCPSEDAWLTTFLRLLSDEAGLLQIVQRHNVFGPYSDSRNDRETQPALWHPRTASPTPTATPTASPPPTATATPMPTPPVPPTPARAPRWYAYLSHLWR